MIRIMTRWMTAAVLLAVMTVVLVASHSVAARARATPVNGGTAVFALGPGSHPDYILPIVDGAHYSVTNIEQFQRLMLRPLYIYGKAGRPVLNEAQSIAQLPVYRNGNRTVTITLKPYEWSDGKPVTSRDFVFFLNLLRANKKSWAAYLPGNLPDNIVGVKVANARTFTLRLNQPYSPTWFTGNQLSQLTPLPQHAWDRKTADGPVGNYDTTTAGAQAVYSFLAGEAKKIGEYASNPLWQVVDGPWKLAEYRSDGYSALVPNRNYSGRPKPKLDKFVMQPFTTATAELNVLRSGKLDYGYIPPSEVSQARALSDYTFAPWPFWGINFIVLNFSNTKTGPIIKQLYVRQALQRLIDQESYIRNLLKGYAVPTHGPVPVQPSSPYVTGLEKSNPYPYSPTKATALLKQHGWDVRPDGTSTCASAGTGANQCGKGIPSGAKLQFDLLYASGVPTNEQQMQAFQSAAARAGVKINLSEAPFNTVISTAASCLGGHACTWEIAWYGGGWLYGVNPIPVADQFLMTGAGSNFGVYNDPQNDRNMRAVQHKPGLAPMFAYENYLAKQLPLLWLPQQPSQLSMIKKNLKGVVQSPILSLTPEEWYFTK